MEKEEQETQLAQTSKSRIILALVWKWLKRISLSLVLLFFLFFLLLQIPYVQNWASKRITSTLSAATGTRVELDHLSLAYFDRLVLKGFYVEDMVGDTLLFCDQLKANFSLNPITIIRRGIEVEEVTLQGARININTEEEAFKNNLELILERVFPTDSTAQVKEKKDPLNFNIGKIFLYNTQFHQENKVKGKELKIYLTEGIVDIKEFNLPGKRVAIRTADFIAPKVYVGDFVGKPAPGHDPWAVEEAPPVDSTALDDADTTKFLFTIDDFYIQEGDFKHDNFRRSPKKLTPKSVLDFRHIEVYDIQIQIDSFAYDETAFTGQVERMSFHDQSGFVLNKISGKKVSVTSTQTDIIGLDLLTPTTTIQDDTLIFQYNEFMDYTIFPDKVKLDGRMSDASVSLEDIMVFAPKLDSVKFFKDNRSEILRIDGRVRGIINAELGGLKSRNLSVKLDDGTDFLGDLRTHSLADPAKRRINLTIKKLNTSMRTLRGLIPSFKPSENFDRLGRLTFDGYLDLIQGDIIVKGNLLTDLGMAPGLDMQLRNMSRGRDKATYSGDLKLVNFDLAGFTQDPNFGLINLSTSVKNGVGMTAETASATLDGSIESFFYKGYNYQNANLNGSLNKNLFDGYFSIKDENIDFQFTGNLNFADSIPKFDFRAKVNKLDILKLNLAKEDLVVSGVVDLNLQNRNLSDLEGNATVYGLSFLQNRKDRYKIDSIVASSVFDAYGEKVFTLRSDIMKADLKGQFGLSRIPDIIIQYFDRNYPSFSDRIGLKSKATVPDSTTHFTYDIHLIDSKGINRLLNPKLGDLQGIELSGKFNNIIDTFLLELDIPKFQYGNVILTDIYSNNKLYGSEGVADLAVQSTQLSEKQQLDPIQLLTLLDRDSINFDLVYDKPEGTKLDNFHLAGDFFVFDSTKFQLRLQDTNLKLLGDPWSIHPDNYLTIGKEFIEAGDFVFTDQEALREIHLDGVQEKGLRLSMFNFDFDIIDQNWDYEPLDFEGRFNVFAQLEQLFKLKDFSVTAVSDTLFINEDDWGHLRLDVLADDFNSPFKGKLRISKDSSLLLADGFFNPKDQLVQSKRGLMENELKNYFDFDLFLNNFPIDIAEYFIGQTISKTIGLFEADLRVYGLPQKPNINGRMFFRDGATTVNYLKTRYFFDRATVKVDNYLFDASPSIIRDERNHQATIYGGIKHDHLRDLGFQARLSTERFLALNTKKGENDLFYGTAIGSGNIEFSGSFKQPNIEINAKAGDSTRIVIPVDYGEEASALKYIRFVDETEKVERKPYDPQLLNGLSLEMNLSFTEEADMVMVFDEQAGDVIRGNGRGNIQILVPRGQDFQMYGDYYIEKGDYLFTLYNYINLLNKDFKIKKGGHIRWDGDPYGATIKLEAAYQGLNTPVANFISEYLINETDDVRNEASKGTDVDLTMLLEGPLTQPIINFDLDFPELIPKLRTYTDGKMRLLRQDQNELNRQVFGLIIAGQFLPSDFTFQTGDLIYNTLSEFASNQLSLLITELFSDLISEDFGVDIDYSIRRQIDLGDGRDIDSGDELEISVTQNLLNDRLSIVVGGNVDFNQSLASSTTNGTFIGNDVVIEYALNEDRSLKFKVYQRLEPDIGGGRRLQIGSGLSFRKEYTDFGSFIRSFKKKKKKG